MENINYIIHLNAVLERFHNDDRIRQGHITLYFAFFQKWNREFFKKTIIINREQIMDRAKIRSKTTYHNYLKDLNEWGYLQYFPSYHPARGSVVKMSIFDTSSRTSTGTSTVQNLASCVPEPVQNLVPSYKHKTKENFNKLARPKNEMAVLAFFDENNWPEIEGKKFYAYYQTKNWKLSGGLNITNWKSQAYKFVENGFKIKQIASSPFSGYVDRLSSVKNKNYGEPL